MNRALAKLEEHDETVEGLNAMTVENNEQLEILNKDIDSRELEKKMLLSISSFQGESYESIGQ